MWTAVSSLHIYMSLFINYRDRRGDRRPSDAVEGPALEDGGRQLRDELALVGVVRDVEVEKARVGDGQRRRPRLRADLDLEARRRREARGARREDEEATERVLVEGADAPPERVGHDGALGPADERERVEDSVGREAVVVRAEQHAPVRR